MYSRTIVTVARLIAQQPFVLVNRDRNGVTVCRIHINVTPSSGERLLRVVKRTQTEVFHMDDFDGEVGSVLMKFKLEEV